MDPQRHAELSARRRGGEPADYYATHSLMDGTKELCSDNRHRFLHTLWGVRRVALPQVGPVLRVSDGVVVKTKDVLEFDHVLADYRGRFIPTLSDFLAALDTDARAEWAHSKARFEEIQGPFRHVDAAMRLLLSPFSVTGSVAALMFTHNTWFLNEVLPRVVHDAPRGMLPGIAPSELFEGMRFRPWMDNGAATPPSYPKTLRAIPSASPVPSTAPSTRQEETTCS